jgi:hypothetical protein
MIHDQTGERSADDSEGIGHAHDTGFAKEQVLA